MSGNTHELNKFLKELAENTRMQEGLKQSAQNVCSEAEVNQLFLEQAENAGYHLTADDIEWLLQKAKKQAENTELTDEALEQVNSGSFLIAGMVLGVIGVAAGAVGVVGGAVANGVAKS